MGESFDQQEAHRPADSPDHLAAGRAERRQRDIERQPQRRAQRPRHAPERGGLAFLYCRRRRHGITLSREGARHQCLITPFSIVNCSPCGAPARSKRGAETFLLDHVAHDLAERLSVVLRKFEVAADIGTPGDAVRNLLVEGKLAARVIAAGPASHRAA